MPDNASFEIPRDAMVFSGTDNQLAREYLDEVWQPTSSSEGRGSDTAVRVREHGASQQHFIHPPAPPNTSPSALEKSYIASTSREVPKSPSRLIDGNDYHNLEGTHGSQKRSYVFQASRESPDPSTGGEAKPQLKPNRFSERSAKKERENQADKGHAEWEAMEDELRKGRFPALPPSRNLQDDFFHSEEFSALRKVGDYDADQFYAKFADFVDAYKTSQDAIRSAHEKAHKEEELQQSLQTYYIGGASKDSSSAMGQFRFEKQRKPLSEDTGGLKHAGVGSQYFPQRLARIARDELIYTYIEGEKRGKGGKGGKGENGDRGDKDDIGMMTVNLATMQRINLHAIQYDLVRLAAEIYRSDAWNLPDIPSVPGARADHRYRERFGPKLRDDRMQLRVLMKEYCTAMFPTDNVLEVVPSLTQGQLGQAWRDWELMKDSTADEPGKDPFRLTTDNPLVGKLVEDVGLLKPHSTLFKKREEKAGYLKYLPGFGRYDGRDSSMKAQLPREKARVSHENPRHDVSTKDERPQYSDYLPGFGRQYSQAKKKTTKVFQLFGWAFGGGLSLIAPMLVMRLHHTLLTQLLTTSIAVMLFAFCIAAFAAGAFPRFGPVDLGPQDVLTATAAYAAVLVVFVSQGS
jgi:hypothetical protein